MQLNKGEIPKDICLPEHIFTETTDFPTIGGVSVQRASVVELVKARIADGTIPAGSGGGAVTSVNTRTGAVVLDKTDVGLANVNNTSDSAKPVSTATQIALNAKQDSLVLTTTGSGAATLVGATLNIPTPATTTNAITSSGSAITTTVDGVAASLTPADGTIDKALGFNTSGVLVKQAGGGGGTAVSQYSAGANVLATSYGTGITATKSSGAWTITVPSGVVPISLSVNVQASDVQTSTDAIGSDWVTVRLTGAGVASSSTTSTYRFPEMQAFLIPSSGAIAVNNPITVSSSLYHVVAAGTNTFTLRKGALSTTNETILTFTGF